MTMDLVHKGNAKNFLKALPTFPVMLIVFLLSGFHFTGKQGGLSEVKSPGAIEQGHEVRTQHRPWPLAPWPLL